MHPRRDLKCNRSVIDIRKSDEQRFQERAREGEVSLATLTAMSTRPPCPHCPHLLRRSITILTHGFSRGEHTKLAPCRGATSLPHYPKIEFSGCHFLREGCLQIRGQALKYYSVKQEWPATHGRVPKWPNGQTVNLLAMLSVVRIHALPPH